MNTKNIASPVSPNSCNWQSGICRYLVSALELLVSRAGSTLVELPLLALWNFPSNGGALGEIKSGRVDPVGLRGNEGGL